MKTLLLLVCGCVIGPLAFGAADFVMVEWSEKDGEKWTFQGMADREAVVGDRPRERM